MSACPSSDVVTHVTSSLWNKNISISEQKKGRGIKKQEERERERQKESERERARNGTLTCDENLYEKLIMNN